VALRAIQVRIANTASRSVVIAAESDTAATGTHAAVSVSPAVPTADLTAGPVLRAWQRAANSAIGRWFFARSVCRRAPYFGTIRPRFIELAPAVCRVRMRKRRAVENHIRTVHALAMGNLCELAAGMVTEVTLPTSMRWLPRGMTIEYLRRAESDVTATARLTKTSWPGTPENIAVPVSVIDTSGTEVVRAVITMYVSPKRP
jgi:acyl-coenzyme A thioesterase PaaI-like protein